MGGNRSLKHQVQDNSQLVDKLNQLTQQLEQNLFQDFANTIGVPIPDATVADVRQVQYDMVYSTDPIINEYVTAAQDLLNDALSESPDVVNKATNLVGVVLNNIVGSGSIQIGGNGDSTKITGDDGKTYICAVYTETDMCDAKDWKTQENFYLSYYAFVVWEPTEDDLAKIDATAQARVA
jgi:hypothetical protein